MIIRVILLNNNYGIASNANENSGCWKVENIFRNSKTPPKSLKSRRSEIKINKKGTKEKEKDFLVSRNRESQKSSLKCKYCCGKFWIKDSNEKSQRRWDLQRTFKVSLRALLKLLLFKLSDANLIKKLSQWKAPIVATHRNDLQSASVPLNLFLHQPSSFWFPPGWIAATQQLSSSFASLGKLIDSFSFFPIVLKWISLAAYFRVSSSWTEICLLIDQTKPLSRTKRISLSLYLPCANPCFFYKHSTQPELMEFEKCC